MSLSSFVGRGALMLICRCALWFVGRACRSLLWPLLAPPLLLSSWPEDGSRTSACESSSVAPRLFCASSFFLSLSCCWSLWSPSWRSLWWLSFSSSSSVSVRRLIMSCLWSSRSKACQSLSLSRLVMNGIPSSLAFPVMHFFSNKDTRCSHGRGWDFHRAQQQVNIKAPQPTNDDNDYIDNHHSNNIHNHDNHDPLDEQATFLREIVAINDDDDDEIFLTQLAEGTTPLPTPARPLQATRLEEEDKWGRSLFQCPLCEARLPHAKMGKHMWGNTDNDPQYAPISIRRLAGPAAKTAEAGRAASSTRSTARLARNGLSRRPLCHGTRSTYSTHETRPSPRKRDERACPPSRSSAARCKHGPQNIQTIGFINCVVVCDEQAVLCR